MARKRPFHQPFLPFSDNSDHGSYEAAREPPSAATLSPNSRLIAVDPPTHAERVLASRQPSGEKAKARDIIAAIRTLQQCEAEHRDWRGEKLVEGRALGAVVFLGREEGFQFLADLLPAGLERAGNRIGEDGERDRAEAGEAGEDFLFFGNGRSTPPPLPRSSCARARHRSGRASGASGRHFTGIHAGAALPPPPIPTDATAAHRSICVPNLFADCGTPKETFRYLSIRPSFPFRQC
jgi:hypothetical protein